MQATTSQTVAAGCLLVVAGAFAVPGVPALWAGRTSFSPRVPPPSWIWSQALWVRTARALLVGLLTLLVGSLAVLASWVSVIVSGILVVLAGGGALVWLAVFFTGRPRAVIPPSWRSGQISKR